MIVKCMLFSLSHFFLLYTCDFFLKPSSWLSSKIFWFPKGEARKRLERYVIYLEQDVIDTRDKK